MDNFSVISKMCDLNDKSILAYDSGNFISARTGKDGWGEVRMAVDNDTIMRLESENLNLYLLIYDIKKFIEIRKQMEKDNE